MKQLLVGIAIMGLLAAHQDYWQWDRHDIVFGFLPYPMAYNIGISIVTALMWMVVCTYCWPNQLDDVQPDRAPFESQRQGERR